MISSTFQHYKNIIIQKSNLEKEDTITSSYNSPFCKFTHSSTTEVIVFAPAAIMLQKAN